MFLLPVIRTISFFSFFFFNDTATTEIYTLSLHDALPISRHDAKRDDSPRPSSGPGLAALGRPGESVRRGRAPRPDRKSTRLNSSHGYISYAVFCLKKKKKKETMCITSCNTTDKTRAHAEA